MQVSEMLPSVVARVGPRVGEAVQSTMGDTVDLRYNTSHQRDDLVDGGFFGEKMFLKLVHDSGFQFKKSTGVGDAGSITAGVRMKEKFKCLKPEWQSIGPMGFPQVPRKPEGCWEAATMALQGGWEHKFNESHLSAGVKLRITSGLKEGDWQPIRDFRVAIKIGLGEKKTVTPAQEQSATINSIPLFKFALGLGGGGDRFATEVRPAAMTVKPWKNVSGVPEEEKLRLALMVRQTVQSKNKEKKDEFLFNMKLITLKKVDFTVNWAYWPQSDFDKKKLSFTLRFTFACKGGDPCWSL